MSETTGPALACPGCGSPDVDLRRGLLCGTCAEAAAVPVSGQPETPDPLVMPADEFAVVTRAWRAWVDGPPREAFDRTVQEIADDAAGPWKARAEAAEARLAELENAVTWGTSCTSCARVLDSAYAETVRREAAEAKLAEIEALCRGHLERAGAERGSVCCPHLAEDILAIAGTEEAVARQLLAQAKAADAEYKVAAVRAGLYTFLHQYGRSTLPTFKVAIDLAVSLRMIVDDLGEEEPGDGD